MNGMTPAITRLCDENASVRRAAIDELDLGPVPHRYALRHVLLADEDAEARAKAAHKLGEGRVRRAIPALVEATNDPMPSVRDHALRALGRLGAPEIVPIAKELVRYEPVWWVRRAAIRATAAAAGKNAVAVLVDALSDPFWRVRHAALQALAALGEDDLDVREQVRRAEHFDRKVDAGRTVARPIASAVKYLDAVWSNKPFDETALQDEAPAAIPFVPKMFDDEDPAVVTARLEQADDADVPSMSLVVWLGDPHAALRTLARRKLRERNDFTALLDALCWLDEPRVPHAAAEVRAICDRLGADDIVLARRVLVERVSSGAVAWASEVASMRGCDESMQRVCTLAREGTPEIRRAAIRGLVRDERSFDIVLAALDDADPLVRSAALEAWEKRPRSSHVIDAWIEALLAFAPRASTVRERRAVVEAAALVGDEALLKRALDDADASVVATAITALGTMNALDAPARSRALSNKDPWIRGAALDLHSALRMAMRDADPWVCRVATDMVVRDRTKVAQNELRAFGLAGARHPDAWVRARVAELLDPLHRDELRALLRLSGDTAPMVRAAAASVLEAMPSVEEHAAALLDAGETDDAVRKSAFTWLVRRGDDAAFVHLVEALERDAEQQVVTQHLEALSILFPERSVELAAHLQNRMPIAAVSSDVKVRPQRATGLSCALRPLGQTGLHVSPLVLSGAHGLLASAFADAFDAGARAFFWEPRYQELSRFLRSRRATRSSFVVVAGTYCAGPNSIRADVVRMLRRLRFDYIDIFLLFWVRSAERLSDEDFEALDRLRTEGKVRTFGFSSHDRKICVDAMNRYRWPVVMTRHSAAHPGAEEQVFPTALERGTGVLTFSATCYGRMLRKTVLSADEPEQHALPSAPDCYRYSLSRPGVSACLTAPRNRDELFVNLDVLHSQEIDTHVADALRAHGAAVRAENRRFDALVRRAPGGPRDRLRELLDQG